MIISSQRRQNKIAKTKKAPGNRITNFLRVTGLGLREYCAEIVPSMDRKIKLLLRWLNT